MAERLGNVVICTQPYSQLFVELETQSDEHHHRDFSVPGRS
jgi:hypothetical protein